MIKIKKTILFLLICSIIFPFKVASAIGENGVVVCSKKEAAEIGINILENYIPHLSSLIDSTNLFTPLDIEKQFGINEGSLNHGEMTLDQFLFMRPTMSSAQYKTPIDNLYLCGSSTHPGGGIHGTNGYNASKEILKS